MYALYGVMLPPVTTTRIAMSERITTMKKPSAERRFERSRVLTLDRLRFMPRPQA